MSPVQLCLAEGPDLLSDHVRGVEVGRVVVQSGQARDASAARAHQVSEGQVIRRMILGRPLDHDFLTDMVDNLLMPLLTRTFPGAGDRRDPAAPDTG
ncbi:hypothetical protein ACFY05_28690 [Microtetraspora fusca]|uniref:Tetracyclin repressor-like C-terminal domain-containing protein n=1 Tax=Microtetraspora fusca TaxID=1997 RepID=A0ABW6VC13_MICFU